MTQPELFAPAGHVLVDDARGRIDYRPGFIAPALADTWFATLRDGLSWRSERRQMYDREVDVPRLTAHFPLRSPDDEAQAPEPLRAAAQLVREATGEPFNSVGLNYYRDGADSVAPHHDHLYELVEGHPIALLSLGHRRRMQIRAQKPPAASFAIDLEPGSLLVMSYATQLHYLHGIAKTKAPVGPRISLAFRVKPTGSGRRGRYD